MGNVVAVHGIGQHRSSRDDMCDSWRAAMLRGLSDVRRLPPADLDLECAFYGHLYNTGRAGRAGRAGSAGKAGSADDGPGYVLDDLTEGFEHGLFLEVAGEDEALPAGDPTKMYLPRLLQRAAVRLEAAGTLGGLSSYAIRWVKQVHRWFTDEHLARAVAAEMDAAMAVPPRAVVAHSLGSVIAFDWLRANPGRFDGTLITIGSPLGLRTIRSRLGLGPGRSWPGGAKAWVNVAADEDAVAAVKKLGPLYDHRIEDQPASNPRRSAHDALLYLGNVYTADALGSALA